MSKRTSVEWNEALNKDREFTEYIVNVLEWVENVEVTVNEQNFIIATTGEQPAEIAFYANYPTRKKDKQQAVESHALFESIQLAASEDLNAQFIFRPTNNFDETGIQSTFPKNIKAIYVIKIDKDKADVPVYVSKGAQIASFTSFDINVQGRGGHAAYPDKTVDATIIGAAIVEALQQVVSRNANPTAKGSLTVTNFQTGEGTYNIIADSAQIKGNIMVLDDDNNDLYKKRIEEIATQVGKAHNAQVSVEFNNITPAVHNDDDLVDHTKEIINQAFGIYVHPETASLVADPIGFAFEETPGVTLFFNQKDPVNTVAKTVQAIVAFPAKKLFEED